ncbi:MAG: tryptophan--tRNA ligase [Chloroflexi bacterium]|nr:tryptophan--tRNA ligase [Chloroflexota bacterium]
MKISLTGIKPTGNIHIGNYFGAIKPALALTSKYFGVYFVADLHALNSNPSPLELQQLIYEVAASWIAFGLDTEKAIFFRQSDIHEIPELTTILSAVTPKGLMNRAHAYKAMVDKNIETGRDPDDGVNMGLFTYPILMAADILLYDSDFVPVGPDQRQHVEIARDIAENINRIYGKTLKLPEGNFAKDLKDIPGIDGRKMSKSYGNTLPIFCTEKELRKQVMRIVTDSTPPEDPKNPDSDNLFQIFKLFGSSERVEEVRQLYLKGGLAYGTLKQELFETMLVTFKPARERFNYLMENKPEIDLLLAQGAEKARELGRPVLARVRKAVGLDR